MQHIILDACSTARAHPWDFDVAKQGQHVLLVPQQEALPVHIYLKCFNIKPSKLR